MLNFLVNLFTRKQFTVLIFTVVFHSFTYADVSLPAVNLGGSNFQDGIAGPGFLFQETLSLYKSDEFLGENGVEIPGENNVDTFVAQSHFAYFSTKKILGGYYGVEALIPYVNVDLNTEFGPTKEVAQVGDLTVSPFILQWTDSTLFGQKFWHRLDINFSIPTGSYDEERQINIGNNFVTFNPHYAFTLEASDNWEVSGRIHYLWNAKNNDPNVSLQAKSTQAGQAFHANFASSYAINNNWRIGIAGYYLKQISSDKVNGSSISGSKEQLFGIGPGVKYAKKGHFIYVNYFTESHVENRTQGGKFSIRYSRVW
jgi:hypothetical protein